jgi:4-hydroxy-4-methyl-2-oxoglutarate aldolase
MTTPISPSALEALAGIDACTVANAIEWFDLRLRNEGYTDATIACPLPALPPMVGYAVTMRVRSSNPPMKGGAYSEGSDWWDQIDKDPVPHVVVIQDMDRRPGAGAFVGEIHAAILQALNCVGVVTNGAVRDLPNVGELGFPLFSGNISASHAYVHVVDVGMPVVVGGLTIRPGDLLHGDCHGIMRVPAEIAPEIPAVAARIRAREHQIVAFCRSPKFTKEGLRKLVQERF